MSTRENFIAITIKKKKKISFDKKYIGLLFYILQ